MTVDALLAQLNKVRKSGDGYVARCPAHEDRSPSLSITMKDGKTLLYCHAGCDVESIVDALGLTLSDLMPPKPSRPRSPDSKFAAIWNAAIPCEIHPYLRTKRVRSYGLRQNSEGLLLIPMRDVDGKLHGLQRIWPDGDKRHMKGSKVRGHFFQIGELGDRGKLATHLVICEGYATGASIYEALGWFTIVAFDASNLEPVAGNLRQVYRRERFVFAADNDRDNRGNPGVTKATAAAKRYGGIAVWPQFRRGDSGTDWNDLEALYGMEAVEQLYEY